MGTEVAEKQQAMTSVLTDVRFAARSLLRPPGFTALGVLVLALGIGSTTALFSLADAAFLRPLPFKEPHQLVEIWGRDDQRTGMRVPGQLLEALRARATTLQTVATHDPSGGVLAGSSGNIDIRGETVSANFINVFGVQPILGRAFVAADAEPGRPAVMLVSFVFWQQHLGGSTDAVGRVVTLDGVPYEIVGIMPREFSTTFIGTLSFWTPYAGNRSRQREREIGYEVVARLRPGVKVDDARREVEAIAAGAEFESWRKTGRRLGVVPLHEEIIGDKARVLMLVLAAASMVLAVACASLAQLLLARADGRLVEFAARKAIGATPVQIFRLALFESVLMSATGGAAGVGIAYGLVPVFLALAPEQIPRLAAASVDLRVLAAAATLSIVTGCAFGLAPALRLCRLSVTQALKRTVGPPSRRRSTFTSLAVVLQVTTAVLLFVLAGLVGQTFLRLVPRSPGFATDGRASFVWSLSERQFPNAADRRRSVSDWMERLEAVPGNLGVAVASRIPFGDDESLNVAVRRADDDRPVNDGTLRTDLRAVSVDYFNLLEIPVVRGRPFLAADSGEAPRMAIVNQTLARRLDPSGNPLGQSIRLGGGAAPTPYEIVGIVGDTRWWGMTLDPLNEVYTPLAQDRASFGYMIVRSQLDIESLTRVIRATFYAAMPGAALPAERRAVPLEELLDKSVAGPRFSAVLIGSFAGATLLLAAFGLFGLVAYYVSQRRGEFGIRVALGAQPGDLIVMSMRWALVLTIVGVISGLLAAVYITSFLRSQLYGVQRLDAIVFVSAGIVMFCVAALAAYLPARGATLVDPITAIRHQ